MTDTASRAGSSMVGDLLSLPPRARDPILATFDAEDLAVLFSAARRELGSPYGLCGRS